MQKKNLFAGSSSSSSSSANDSDDDDVLAEQMAAVAARERRRDPHAYTPFDPNKKKREIAPIGSISKANDNAVRSSGSDDDNDSDDDNGADKAVTVSMKGKKDVRHENKKKNNKKANSRGDNNNNNNNNNNNEEEEEDSEVDGIRINKAYAAKYEEVKRKKELQQLTVKYGKKLRIGEEDEEEDEEDEEDDGAFLLTEDKEIAFAKAFLAIRQAAAKVKKQQKEGKKSKTKSDDRDESDSHDNATDTDNTEDPLKVPTAVFFPPPEEQVRENTKVFEEAIVKKRQERKKFTLADEYRRGVVAEAAVEDEEREKGKHHPQGSRRIQPLSAKERELRDSFLKNIAESTETFDVQPVVPVQSRQEQQEASGNKESVAKRLLKGAFAIKEAEGSSSAEEDPNEVFLRDFFVEELWKPENNKKKAPKKLDSSKTNDEDKEDEDEDEESSASEEIGNNYASLAQLAQDEEDERFYADAEVWEREYQQRAYRHQEEAAEYVQSFPRPIGEHAAGLLRKSVISARKGARQRRMQRMEEMREQQVAELRRLKTLKRQEIEAQRALIASVAGIVKNSSKGSSSGVGNDDGRRKKKTGQNMGDENDDGDEDAGVKRLMALWSEKDLEEDFDPKKFDKKMASIFDDAYYDEENVDEEEMAFFEDEQDGTGEGVKSENEDDEAEKENDDDEPELFKATSLQEAMTMAVAKRKEDSEGKKTRNTQQQQQQQDAGIGGDMFGDDPLALLYPSAAMRAAEEASFEGRRTEIERMIQQQQQQQQQHGVNKDGDENAEVLQQLKAELQQKEQEYLQLHHESTLDGGALKARFKYRSVDPEDFTLSVEEILARDDRQLNMLVPMNCYAAYLTAEANRRDRIRAMGRRGWKRGGNGEGNAEGERFGNNKNSGGVRVLDSGRRSRRYGDVQRTALVDPTMSEEAGREWAAAVQGGLRRLRAKLDDNDMNNNNNNNNNNNSSDKKEVVGKQRQHRGNDGNRHDKRIHAAGAVRGGNMAKKPRYEEGRRGGERGRGGG
ncbi:Kri1-like [Trypanosoma melophagium]|uniref:Kri1-like n=1 Tax=Trypanosoma melophagium TaxID=715481 RepID=UPI00351A4827|nr:Kri1-like [Trypanosoma melophagium]